MKRHGQLGLGKADLGLGKADLGNREGLSPLSQLNAEKLSK